MPRPEGQALRQQFTPRLTTMAIGYLGGFAELIGKDMFPGLAVGAESGEYNIFPRGEWLRRQGKKLANGEPAPLGGFKFDKGLYSVGEYGVAANWTQRDLNNADVGGIGSVNLKNMKTRFVTQQAALEVEVAIAEMVRTDANWGFVKTGVASSVGANQFLQFNDPASDPIALFKAWKLEMQLATGFRPNRFQITRPILDALTEHPDLIDRVKYTGGKDNPAKITIEALKSLLEIEHIYVPESVQNVAQEGAADDIQWIWGKDAFLYYAPDQASKEVPSAAYRMNWVAADGYVGPQPEGRGVNAEGLFIANYTTKRPWAEWVESRWYTEPKVTGANLGMRLKDVVA